MRWITRDARAVETFLIERQKLRQGVVDSLVACQMDPAYIARIDSVVKWSAATLRAELGREMDSIGSDAKAQELLLLRIKRALADDAGAMESLTP